MREKNARGGPPQVMSWRALDGRAACACRICSCASLQVVLSLHTDLSTLVQPWTAMDCSFCTPWCIEVSGSNNLHLSKYWAKSQLFVVWAGSPKELQWLAVLFCWLSDGSAPAPAPSPDSTDQNDLADQGHLSPEVSQPSGPNGPDAMQRSVEEAIQIQAILHQLENFLLKKY